MLIRETLNFEKKRDPKTALGVGKIVLVKEMLDKIFPEDIHRFLRYKINSLDNIEIFYDEKLKKASKSEHFPRWVIKYVEKERYFIDTVTDTISIHSSTKYTDHYIYERNFYSDDPRRMKFGQTPRFKLVQTNDYDDFKETQKQTPVVLKALNDQYGPVSGFELVEESIEE